MTNIIFILSLVFLPFNLFSQEDQYQPYCKLSSTLEYSRKLDSNIINGFYKEEYRIDFNNNTHVQKFLDMMTKSLQKYVDTILRHAGSNESIRLICAQVPNAETGTIGEEKVIKVNLNLVFRWMKLDEGATMSTFGLLSHEVAHWVLKHKPMKDISAVQSRRNEREADSLAGYLCGTEFYKEFGLIFFGPDESKSIADIKRNGDANLPRITRYIDLLPQGGSNTHPPAKSRKQSFENGYFSSVRKKLIYMK